VNFTPWEGGHLQEVTVFLRRKRRSQIPYKGAAVLELEL
jgi:hypothetical protein